MVSLNTSARQRPSAHPAEVPPIAFTSASRATFAKQPRAALLEDLSRSAHSCAVTAQPPPMAREPVSHSGNVSSSQRAPAKHLSILRRRNLAPWHAIEKRLPIYIPERWVMRRLAKITPVLTLIFANPTAALAFGFKIGGVEVCDVCDRSSPLSNPLLIPTQHFSQFI